jgi:predicted DCC family thiol-disulfide oxidoreductase YuxK
MQPSAQNRPLLVYDGDCAFCVAWVRYWQALTGDRIEYAPFQTAAGSLPQIPLEQFRKSVQLVLPGGEVRCGAHAVFETLACAGNRKWLWAYQHVPGFAPATEAAYRMVARWRGLLWKLTRLTIGPAVQPLHCRAIEWLFWKALGVVYLIAFLSFGRQPSGLIGANWLAYDFSYKPGALDWRPTSPGWIGRCGSPRWGTTA